MRVLIAPDRLGPDLSAARVAGLLADGWFAGAPADVLDLAPLGDGGPGLVEAVHAAVGGELVPRTVAGPRGSVPVALLRLGDGTVLAEVAQVLGGAVLGGTTGLVGSSPAADLLTHALELDPVRVVVGVGGLAAHDAGAGLLAGLGLDVAALRGGGEGLAALGPQDLRDLPDVLADIARRLGGVPIEVAVDTEVPLLGLHGASALLTVPDATGLSTLGVVAPSTAQGLERAFGHWVHVLGTVLGPGRVRELAGRHGAGAGGGLAFALGLLGADLRPGADLVAELAGLDRRAAQAELVLTATTVLDPHSLHDSAVASCVRAAADHAVPVVVVAGEGILGRREHAAQGIAGVYALADGGAGWQDLGDPSGALVDRARRIARTWSR